jgi:hypothetical protein
MSRLVLTVEAEAKRQVPVRTGTLRRSITSVVESAGERGRVGSNLRYALWVHEGTGLYGPKHHVIVIVPRAKKALFWKGARHPVRRVNHPGIKGQPFLRNALATSRDSLQRIIASGEGWLQEAIDSAGGGRA